MLYYVQQFRSHQRYPYTSHDTRPQSMGLSYATFACISFYEHNDMFRHPGQEAAKGRNVPEWWT